MGHGGRHGDFARNNQWRNKNETSDNKDNDNNGFIDDIFGIGYDIKGEKSIAMLELMQSKMKI